MIEDEGLKVFLVYASLILVIYFTGGVLVKPLKFLIRILLAAAFATAMIVFIKIFCELQ